MMTTNVAAGVLLVGVMAIAGCEKPAPPSAAPKPGGALGGLSENPQSLLGKSAANAKNVAKQAEQSQAAASGMADQITGQAGLVTVDGVEFRPPSAWEKVAPANAMQKVALRVAPNQGEGETLCVWLSGMGGGTQSNVELWRKQVTNPETNQPAESKVENRTVAGMKVTIVSMSGTYASMTSGATTPLQGQGFKGAIVEAPGGSIFVRMTGPKEQVDEASAAWEQMILGMRKP